jgi:hypothetical protein
MSPSTFSDNTQALEDAALSVVKPFFFRIRLEFRQPSYQQKSSVKSAPLRVRTRGQPYWVGQVMTSIISYINGYRVLGQSYAHGKRSSYSLSMAGLILMKILCISILLKLSQIIVGERGRHRRPKSLETPLSSTTRSSKAFARGEAGICNLIYFLTDLIWSQSCRCKHRRHCNRPNYTPSSLRVYMA